MQGLPISTTGNDKIEWTSAPSGILSIKSAYHALSEHSNAVQWSKVIWGKNHIPRCSFIIWLALKKRLAVKTLLHKWGGCE